MKKLLLLVLVIAVAGGLWFFLTLDSRLKTHIEKTASTLAGVPVTIDLLETRLFRGQGVIAGLKVANPPGYRDAYAFEMDSIQFKVDTGSLFSQPLVVRELVFSAPVINLEVKENLGTNLQDILAVSNQQIASGDSDTEFVDTDQVSQDGKGSSKDKKSKSAKRDSSGDEPSRVIYERLEIKNASLNARRGEDTWSDTLDDITMTNLGGDEGISTRVLGITIVRKLSRTAIEQAAKRSLTDYVEDKIKDLSDKLLESLNKE